MARRDAITECFACRKHREEGPLLPGGPVGDDELAVVSQLPPAAPGLPGGPVYLGHLLVEPRQHAPGLADLTDAEARAVGLWRSRASRALREVAAPSTCMQLSSAIRCPTCMFTCCPVPGHPAEVLVEPGRRVARDSPRR
ncbi:MAG TPA: hypothetical protein VGA04_09665 [Streptosporangiaceae bacterium]